jgi:ribonuclease HII
MKEAAIKHPYYGWEQNMGYPTKKHRDAIRIHGTTPFHRLTFQLLPEQLSLGL